MFEIQRYPDPRIGRCGCIAFHRTFANGHPFTELTRAARPATILLCDFENRSGLGDFQLFQPRRLASRFLLRTRYFADRICPRPSAFRNHYVHACNPSKEQPIIDSHFILASARTEPIHGLKFRKTRAFISLIKVCYREEGSCCNFLKSIAILRSESRRNFGEHYFDVRPSDRARITEEFLVSCI